MCVANKMSSDDQKLFISKSNLLSLSLYALHISVIEAIKIMSVWSLPF